MDELNFFMNLNNPIFQLLIALFLGAFVGIRRELELQKENIKGFRGLRTTALVSVFGTLSTFFQDFKFLPILFFVILSIFIILAYQQGIKKNRIGLTSEISLILIFWSGVLIGFNQFVAGIVLAMFIAISDAYKDKMHNFAKTLKLKEWSGTLEMILISLVVLPFLPKKAIDPWGVFVPYDVWVLVVLVTGIGFMGYFLNKILKKKNMNSLYLTSFLGSIISSTVVTVELSQKTKKVDLGKYFVPSILLAISVMLVRDIVIIILASASLNWEFIKIPSLMFVFSFAWFSILYFLNKNNQSGEKLDIEEDSPFEIIPALKFALVFVLILFVIHFTKEFFGDKAIYLTTSLVALVDTETIILPALESFRNGKLDFNIVGNIIGISIVINTLVKLFYIWIFAKRKYFWKTILPILIISFGAVLISFFV